MRNHTLASIATAVALFGCYGCGGRDDKNLQLMRAVHQGDTSEVRSLIQKGVNINFVERSPDRFTPLLRACYAGQYEVACVLVDAGADVRVEDSFGMTPLEYAIGPSDASVLLVRQLLRHGADPKKGLPYLQLKNIHPEIKGLLLSSNATQQGE